MSTPEKRRELAKIPGYLEWCRGEPGWVCRICGNSIEHPTFSHPIKDYTFHLTEPPKPKYRPFTWDEIWERRDWWVTHKDDKDAWQVRLSLFSKKDAAVYVRGAWYTLSGLLDLFAICNPVTNQWQPCGMEVGE